MGGENWPKKCEIMFAESAEKIEKIREQYSKDSAYFQEKINQVEAKLIKYFYKFYN